MTKHTNGVQNGTEEVEVLLDNEKKSLSSPISPTLRLLTNVLALISVFFFSGIIFGWAPLELLLLEEGQYSELCPIGGGEEDIVSEEDAPPMEAEEEGSSCAEQRTKLSFIFTMAQFTLSLSSLPVGFLLDNISKSHFILLTALIEIIGLVSFGMSESLSSNGPDYFLFGYCCMALGGCMSMLGAFPASFLLPQYQAGLLASISCLFDGSSAVFFGFLSLFQGGQGMTRKSMFSAWAVGCGLTYLVLAWCWYLCEQRDWQRVIQEENDAEDAKNLSEDDDENNNKNDEEDGQEGENQPTTVLAQYLDRINRLNIHDWPVSRQVVTPEFALALIFASIHMLRCNYFIMTVDNFLYSIGDTTFVYAKQFSWMLPCGIIFVPVIEYTLTHWGVVSTLHFANLIGFVFGFLSLIPSLPLQVVNFGVFTMFRAYLYATLNTVVAITFGVTTMGRMIGCTFATAAIVSLAQYPAVVLTETTFEGNFVPMNIVMLGLCALPFGMALWYVYYVTSLPITTSDQDHNPSHNDPIDFSHIDYGSIQASAAIGSSIRMSRRSLRWTVEEAARSPSLLGSPGSATLNALRNARRQNHTEEHDNA